MRSLIPSGALLGGLVFVTPLSAMQAVNMDELAPEVDALCVVHWLQRLDEHQNLALDTIIGALENSPAGLAADRPLGDVGEAAVQPHLIKASSWMTEGSLGRVYDKPTPALENQRSSSVPPNGCTHYLHCCRLA